MLGVLFTLIGITIGQLPITLAISSASEGQISSVPTDELLQSGFSNNAVLFLLLLSFVGGLIALLLAVRFFHKKPVLSVLTGGHKFRFRRLFYALSLWLLISGVLEVVAYFMDPSNYTLDFRPSSWVILVVISLTMLPLQCIFEEVFCRGYLLQGLTALFKHPLLAVFLSTAVFAALHLANPEVRMFGMGIMLTYYALVGAILAIVAILDDGLELSIGIHAATNIYGAVFVNFSGSALTTDSLFFVSKINPGWMLIFFIFSVGIFLLIASRKFAWDWQKLFIPVTKTDFNAISQDET